MPTKRPAAEPAQPSDGGEPTDGSATDAAKSSLASSETQGERSRRNADAHERVVKGAVPASTLSRPMTFGEEERAMALMRRSKRSKLPAEAADSFDFNLGYSESSETVVSKHTKSSRTRRRQMQVFQANADGTLEKVSGTVVSWHSALSGDGDLREIKDYSTTKQYGRYPANVQELYAKLMMLADRDDGFRLRDALAGALDHVIEGQTEISIRLSALVSALESITEPAPVSNQHYMRSSTRPKQYIVQEGIKASEFLRLEWGDQMLAGRLSQTDVRKADPKLMQALDNEFRGRRDDLRALLPSKKDVGDALLAAAGVQPGSQSARTRAVRKIKSRTPTNG